ncbi:MAG: tetratricopeptide repeat protein [bacterium]|nr:tetratricopeptide repeat protein [bacterium]
MTSDDYARARILLMCGRHREALREFRRILRRNPRDLDALYQVARLRTEMGKEVKARKLLGRCARIDVRGKWSREIVSQLKRLACPRSPSEGTIGED